MTLFFFVVALDLKWEMILGELHNVRMAALSLAAVLGGMAVPAGLFFLLLPGGSEEAHGWGSSWRRTPHTSSVPSRSCVPACH